ncbi:protein kinase PINOID-like [Dioscorea cayenensis subsp. rotundata]|uniref:non-specific serine/threonine protein kinase n=1 Tax=Dioscorea cayennensis subsp. rotundata TaxID=55577 RepID=A0AB40CLJ0_DIOCR|nr:protein kinase PINOID-like [Dioscorea cayenensis subsp. rotundata]
MHNKNSTLITTSPKPQEMSSQSMISDLSLDSDEDNSSQTQNSSQSSTSSSSGSYDHCPKFSPPSATKLYPQDFELIRRIGTGDIGTVYLCHLRNDPTKSYAMKIVDNRELAKKNKLNRADTERTILRTLHHPFLPKLHADFAASPHYSCLVMDYCSGGDLHTLRHQLPSRRFPLASARFYAAEVLLALEYLHMMGIVYRDLKPENILIRSDGHIMLTDFDLSLQSTTSPAIDDSHSNNPSCLPFISCKTNPYQFVAEPVTARSTSFVGTHEYVAPEIATGKAHGSAVDWWAYGVFLYENLYGHTPFAGKTNESTLFNIVKRGLVFPAASSPLDSLARDLISRLLVKDPVNRLGSRRGAADIKAHPFFKGVNFALLRSCKPPVIPGLEWSDRKKPARFDLF